MGVELWHFRYSHFNEKVRWALDLKQVPYISHLLVPGFHPPTVLRLTGQQLTPVLRLDGELLWDSTAIIAALEQRHPDPVLYPADRLDRERALATEEWLDEEVGPDIRRLFYHCFLDAGGKATARMSTAGFGRAATVTFRLLWPILKPVIGLNMKLDAPRVARARQLLPTYFDRLEKQLGGRDYLVGDTLSIADLTAAALLCPLVRPSGCPFGLPAEPPDPWLELRDTVALRPGFAWVCQIYDRHRGSCAAMGGPPA
ncbi:MAG: glutathione S-transferase family protein [Deltaproteobacteria bacterium]|nr:glutathione S-transferase family protein [Deltaproteobacteria bacterium]